MSTLPHLIKRWLLRLAIILVSLMLAGFGFQKYCLSLTFLRSAGEEPYQLWIRALKGIGGPVRYIGSEGDFSYFRAGVVFPARFKARTDKIHLPRTFPLGSAEPYIVKEAMVAAY